MALQRNRWLSRAVLENGQKGAAVGIPAEVRRKESLEAGADGDTVDLEYDGDDGTLTIHFPDD